jgi:hypothetical protein
MLNTKIDIKKWFKKTVFGLTEFQTLLVHLNQTIVWLQIVKTFEPKGKLKEEINKAITILSILSKRFPISDDLFDRAIDISDSLYYES